MSLPIGGTLGHYEILSIFGKGGMGEVYRARDPRLGRDVAIKVSAEQFTERFEREARVIASLNHPNICTLHDVGPNYLVMELVEGPTLAERIKQGPIPLDEALGIATQIGYALEAAHEKGIVHRDLKPGNVKITPAGLVKVLDFGLAKVGGMPVVQGDNSPTMTMGTTQAGMILGTAAYMSPEQASGKPVDKRADIWAFGVVLYEMLTGSQLFQGDTTTELMASVLKDDPDWKRIPARTLRLLRSCLQKDPKRRLRDISDARLLLDEAGAPEVQASPRVGRLWPALAALLLLTTLSVGFIHFREEPPVAQSVRLQVPIPEGLTFNPGTAATISPDGRWLAFAATSTDNVARMYVRALDSLEAKPLTGTEVVGLSSPPFWSFDSRSIAFGAGGKLKKVEISGGPPQSLCDLPTVPQGGAWNRDGVIVFPAIGSPLLRVSASGGPATPVTILAPGESGHRWPQFLPDGRHFLYHRASNSPDKAGIFVGSIDAKPEQQSTKPLMLADRQGYYVPSETGNKGWLLFLREGTLLARAFDPGKLELSGDPIPVADGVGSFPGANYGMFSVSENGVLVYRGGGAGLPQLTWRDPQGSTITTLGEPGLLFRPSVSPDGKQVAVTQGLPQSNQDIWVLDVVRGTSTRLTFDPHRNDFPVWSPDGTRIAFASNRGGHLDLYEKAANGAGEDRLLFQSDEDKTPTSWSHDGRYLLFDSVNAKTRSDMWILPLVGDRKPFLFLSTEFQEGGGAFSPDGRWISYISGEAGLPDVFVRPFTPDPRWRPSQFGRQMAGFERRRHFSPLARRQ